MDCKTFQTRWLQQPFLEQDAESQQQLQSHYMDCTNCYDFTLKQQLEQRGVIVERYPCVHMAQYAEFYCADHHSPQECEDAVVHYSAKFDEYSLPHGDGSSEIVINNCPWCGTELPASKRDLWFQSLEQLGFDDPSEQELPAEFHTDSWWRKNSD